MTADIFLKELQRLINLQPKPQVHVNNVDNCIDCNYVFDSKNLFSCFDVAQSEDSMYLFDSFMSVKCMDCDYAGEAQLCYESIDPYKCYNCNYVDNCARLRDSSYCYGCWGGNNLFGCSNLRDKSFCIFNRQFTEQQYFEEIKKYENLPAEKNMELLAEVRKRFPRTQTIEARNENSNYGNYVYDSKNCYMAFDAARSEGCLYVYDSFDNKTCVDMTYGFLDELSYQNVDTNKIFNADYLVYSFNCSESSYLFNCSDVKNSLGCVGVKHKQYCILNRQFTQEEYEKISAEILNELRTTNPGWGTLKF